MNRFFQLRPERSLKLYSLRSLISISLLCLSVVLHSQDLPDIEAPPDFTVDANQPDCLANIYLPPADVTICDPDFPEDITIDVTWEGPTINQNGDVTINDLEKGEYVFTYRYIDFCMVEVTDDLVVTVKDLSPPNPICKTKQTVSLNNLGCAFIPADYFDLESYDNCKPHVSFKIRRMFAEEECVDEENPDNLFSDFMKVCCADITVMAIMRVYDRYVDEGPVDEDYLEGHFDDCMVELTIQEKIAPDIFCPPDLTLDCPFHISDITVYGVADAFDACGLDFLVEEDPQIMIDQCNAGMVIRTFIAEDIYGNSSSCQQKLTIKNLTPFDGDNPELLVWPPDVTIEGCGGDFDVDITGEPTINDDACALVGTSVTEEIFDIVEDACFKVARTWNVLDWCQFDPQLPNPFVPENGFWTHTQYIKIIDVEAPDITVSDDITVLNFTDDCSDITVNIPPFTASDCTPEEDLEYSYEIDFGSNGDKVGPFPGNDPSGVFPLGTHTITAIVDDKCGNESRDEFLVNVSDGKAPTIILYDGLAVELMIVGEGESMIDVEAEMLVKDALDNCTADENILFSFSPDPTDNIRMFTCADVADITIDVYATDEAGNQSWASTSLSIQDNAGNCIIVVNLIHSISGAIFSVDDQMLHGSSIMLYKSDAMMAEYPSVDGHYSLEVESSETDYRLMPEFEDVAARGLSTLDILLIQQHILGLNPLASSYDRMAADVNQSGSITAADLVEIKKVLLQVQPEFNSGVSWGFVDSEVTMDESSETEVVLYRGYSIPANDQNIELDFTGFKYGDVNGTVYEYGGGLTETRNTPQTKLLFQSNELQESVKRIDFIATDELQFEGLQFQMSIDADPQDLLGIKSEFIPISHQDYTINSEDGNLMLSMVLNPFSSAEIAEGDILFSLIIKGAEKTQTVDLIDGNLSPEIYRSGLQPTELIIEPYLLPEHSFELHQNRPNPFNSSTIIPYSLDEPLEISLSIFDITGKVLLEYSGYKEKGLHEFELKNNENLKPGVYFYQLECRTGSITKKMIIDR